MHIDGRIVISGLTPLADTAILLHTTDDREIQIVLLSDADTLAL